MQTAPAVGQTATPHTDAALAARDAARAARLQRLAEHHAQILGRYTPEQQRAIRRVYEAVKVHSGTSGGNTCAKLLLGLYNGGRFPFDLTDLRLLDGKLFQAAMTVLVMDARHTYCEVHVLLDAIYADGCSTGDEFERWAYYLKHGKRCKREFLAEAGRVRTVDIEAFYREEA